MNNPHVGTSFDDFLKDEKIQGDIRKLYVEKAISLGLGNAMADADITTVDQGEQKAAGTCLSTNSKA